MTKTKKLLYKRIKTYLSVQEGISPYRIDGPFKQAILLYGPNVIEPGHFTKTGANNLLRQLRFEKAITDQESKEILNLLYCNDNETVLTAKEFINLKVKQKYKVVNNKVYKI